uniref:Subtilisin-chymotrypsin inhibitor-2A n=5 Tax=Triticinae TaxID=1648030 RepID=A0A453N153_AEGTS
MQKKIEEPGASKCPTHSQSWKIKASNIEASHCQTIPDPCRFPCIPTCYKYRPSPPSSPESRSSTSNQTTPQLPSSLQQISSFRPRISAEMGDAKSSWPEVLGAPSEVAKRKILSDRPDVRVFVAPVGSVVTTDFDDKRVRVFVSTRGDVAQVPNIG